MITKEQIFFDILKDMYSPYDLHSVRSGVDVSHNPIVLHGPYITLPAGRWTVRVSGRIEGASNSYVDAVGEGGTVNFGFGVWDGDVCQFEIENQFPVERFEIRICPGTGAFARIDHVSVAKSSESFADRTFSLYNRLDLQLLLDKSCIIDREVIARGSWEPEKIDYFKDLVHKYSNHDRDLVLLDIGAYFGLYSLVLARTNLFSKILAFEADILNYRQLNANLLLNDSKCLIESQFLAISDAKGVARFAPSMDHSDGNRGGVGISEHGVMVERNKIDNLVRHKSKKTFIKIDVVGHELQVLEGMKELLQNNKAAVQVDSLHNEKQITEKFKALGYRLLNKIGSDCFYSNFPADQ